MKRSQSGFSFIEPMIIIICLLILGGIGWMFWTNQAKPAPNSTNNSPDSKNAQTKKWCGPDRSDTCEIIKPEYEQIAEHVYRDKNSQISDGLNAVAVKKISDHIKQEYPGVDVLLERVLGHSEVFEGELCDFVQIIDGIEISGSTFDVNVVDSTIERYRFSDEWDTITKHTADIKSKIKSQKILDESKLIEVLNDSLDTLDKKQLDMLYTDYDNTKTDKITVEYSLQWVDLSETATYTILINQFSGLNDAAMVINAVSGDVISERWPREINFSSDVIFEN